MLLTLAEQWVLSVTTRLNPDLSYLSHKPAEQLALTTVCVRVCVCSKVALRHVWAYSQSVLHAGLRYWNNQATDTQKHTHTEQNITGVVFPVMWRQKLRIYYII